MAFGHRLGFLFLWVLLLWVAVLCVATCGAQPGPERAADETASRRDPVRVLEAARAAPRLSFLWRATPRGEPQKVVHLLGSIHLASPDFYPLDPSIEEAFDASDALAVELDLTEIDPAKVQTSMIRRALLPAGETLKDRLGAETWERLRASLAERNVPLATVTNFEPWFAAMMLDQIQLKDSGLDPALGVDMYFLDRAGTAKPIESLETYDGQLDVFDGLSPELQEWVLVEALDGLGPEGRDELDRMLAAWRAGDGEAMDGLIRESLSDQGRTAPLYEALISRRNAAMAEAIDALSDRWDRLFVVVGAGHLVGDDGLVALLEKRGYGVTQVAKKDRK
jgi:uncharacterized protein YbaP (TraB family)